MASASAHKKRKISDRDDGPNGKVKSGKKRPRTTTPADDPLRAHPPFKAFCPPDSQDTKQDQAWIGDARLADTFEWQCAVASAEKDPRFHVDEVYRGLNWDEVKAYRNFKLTETTFSQGDLVYVLRDEQPPPPPGADASDDELLKYDKKYYWPAKIIQCRARSDKEVWVLVAWFYWPEEMINDYPKQSRDQASYGAGELILSNFFDVIDATTISNTAEIDHLDELDDDAISQPKPQRFWRQTFKKHQADLDPKSTTALSNLRTFCNCRRPYNPDHIMYHCAKPSCNQWNHEECLIDAIGKQGWKKYGEGNMEHFVQENALNPARSFADRMLQPVKAVGKFFEEKAEDILEQGVQVVTQEALPDLHLTKANGTSNGPKVAGAVGTPQKSARGRPRKDAPAWATKLEIKIVADDDKPLMASISEKTGRKRQWQVKVDCLCCGKTME